MPPSKRKPNAAALLKRQKAAFLVGLRDDHTISHAAERAGVHRQRCYEWRDADLDFATAWADIEARSTELLEREAYRRAAVGTEKPVYQGGELVGHVREFSDVLLMFLLKARRPDTYREHHHVEHAGDVEVNVNLVTDPALREQAASLRRGLAAARPVKPGRADAGNGTHLAASAPH